MILPRGIARHFPGFLRRFDALCIVKDDDVAAAAACGKKNGRQALMMACLTAKPAN